PRRNRAREDRLPSGPAEDEEGAPGVARGAVVCPDVDTRKVGNAAQTVRAQVAAERAVMGQTSPRVLVRERAFARLVFGANPEATRPSFASVVNLANVFQAEVEGLHQIQRSLRAGRTGAEECHNQPQHTID